MPEIAERDDLLEHSDVLSQVYVLENSDQKVATAKSQFADEYDVEYSGCNGSIIHNSGGSRGTYGKSGYPALCTVVHTGEFGV